MFIYCKIIKKEKVIVIKFTVFKLNDRLNS